MKISLRSSLQEISNPEHLDASVNEVFATMLGWTCRRAQTDQNSKGIEAGSVTAVVGFGGILMGACIFRAELAAALRIAGRMMGAECTQVDATVQDAVGELCNMLAGCWKRRIPELAADCGLSVPAVITGRDYQIRVQTPEFELRHLYLVEDFNFAVTLVCHELQ